MKDNDLITLGDIMKRLNIDCLLYKENMKRSFYELIARGLIIKQYKIDSLLVFKISMKI